MRRTYPGISNTQSEIILSEFQIEKSYYMIELF